MEQFVILSSIEWDAAWQRHQIFAAQLAAKGHEVFFVENTGFRNFKPSDISRIGRKLRSMAFGRAPSAPNKIPAGVRVINPLVLPPTGGIFRGVNRGLFVPRVMEQLRSRGLRTGPVVIVYLATATTLELIRQLRPSAVIHDCASHFAANPGAPKDFAETERRLLEKTALVVTDSDFLFNLMKAKHSKVIQIHQGVSDEFFGAAPPRSAFNRFCYYGTWVPDLDPAYLNALAEAGFEVSVSGFMKGEPPPFHASIRRLGPASREELVKRLEQFDAFLLPHKMTEFHKGVIPAKIYECLAMGRPVIGAPLPSLQAFKELVYISDKPSDWVRIAKDLSKTETANLRESRIQLARKHTHQREFERLYDALRQAAA